MLGYWDAAVARVRTTLLTDGTPAAGQNWSDVEPAQNRGGSRQLVADLANDGSTVYGLFADISAPDVLFSDTNINEAGWGTDIFQISNPSDDFGWIRGTVFTHSAGNGGAKVYGYTYDQGNESAQVGYGTGYIYYRELVIGS